MRDFHRLEMHCQRQFQYIKHNCWPPCLLCVVPESHGTGFLTVPWHDFFFVILSQPIEFVTLRNRIKGKRAIVAREV
jgi:hypothetical protein